MVSLGKTPSTPGELATPRTLASHVPTKTEERRPSSAVSPSQLIEQAAKGQKTTGGWAGSSLLFVLLAFAGGLAGMAATWWLFGGR
jgi:hypothetical protein